MSWLNKSNKNRKKQPATVTATVSSGADVNEALSEAAAASSSLEAIEAELMQRVRVKKNLKTRESKTTTTTRGRRSQTAEAASASSSKKQATKIRSAKEMRKKSTLQLKLDKADCLCALRRHKDALALYQECLTQCAGDCTTGGDDDDCAFSAQRLRPLVDSLAAAALSGAASSQAHISAVTGGGVDAASPSSSTPAHLARPPADPFSCVSCAGVPREPVSAPCGHVYCTRCLQRSLQQGKKGSAPAPSCGKCGGRLRTEFSVNVLVKRLCQKYWPEELQAQDLRETGNKFFQQGRMNEALEAYNKAVDLAPGDHLSLSNRSHAFLKCDRAPDALSDADAAVSSRPGWAKGHYRRAAALRRMGRNHQSFLAYFECLLLEEDEANRRPVRAELAVVLHACLVDSKKKAKAEGMEFRNGAETSDGGDTDDEDDDSLKSSSSGGGEVEAVESASAETVSHSSSTASAESTSGSINRRRRHSRIEESSPSPSQKRPQDDDLNRLVDQALSCAARLRRDLSESGAVAAASATSASQSERAINPSRVSSSDFECALCFRMLFRPVTTPCGHTFCKGCLDRTLDHGVECPICKGPLAQHLAERRSAQVEFVARAAAKTLPGEAQERLQAHEAEMAELAGCSDARATDGRIREIPVFVCTMSFPRIPCPLHVFEPRYRLMIRRCMETGTREFGMCCAVDESKPFADYGTMLEIRDIQYFPDGRAVVDAVGGRRFHVLDRSMRDGYNTARVEFVKDNKVDSDSLDELKSLHDRVHLQASDWFGAMSEPLREGILSHYGTFPKVEAEYWRTSNGPAWTWWMLAIMPLDPKMQLQILAQTVLRKRLEALQRILRYLTSSQQQQQQQQQQQRRQQQQQQQQR